MSKKAVYAEDLLCSIRDDPNINGAHFARVKEHIEAAPPADAVEVVHGRWIAVPSSDMMTGKAYKCSECNKMRYGSYHPNYCQCCGAKMDGGNENDL